MPLQIDGNILYSKAEALNLIADFHRSKSKISGLEVVMVESGVITTDYRKSLWIKSSRLWYSQSKNFIQKQMIGPWQWVDIKI
jgi:hypothetical protein